MLQMKKKIEDMNNCWSYLCRLLGLLILGIDDRGYLCLNIVSFSSMCAAAW